MTHVFIPITETIQLQRWSLNDDTKLFKLVDSNRAHLTEFLPWVPHVKQESDSLKYIQNAIENFEKNGMELGIWYEDKLVGCIGLHEIDRSNFKTSIGYWLGRDFQGKGIMIQSVKALINYCFSELTMNRVEIQCAIRNTKSRAIPEKLGFAQEGVLREAELVQNRYLDLIVYSMLKKDWDRIKKR